MKQNNVPMLLQEGKLPPQATDVESIVLGAILLERSAIDRVIEMFKPEIFYKQEHQTIAYAVLDLYRNNEPIDIITVTKKLKTNGKLEEVGGAYFIATLTDRVGSSANIEYHCRIIVQEYIKREMIMMSSGIITESYLPASDSLEILESGQKVIDNITNMIEVGTFDNVSDLLTQSAERNIEIRNKSGVSGVPSGFIDIDKITGGWQPSDLVILAARPGMGKTSLMLNFARNAAVQFQIPTAIFSLEMSSQQLIARMQSSETGISLDKYLRKGLEDWEVEENKTKCKDLSKAKLYIDDTSGLSVFELKIKLRKLKKDKGVRFCVIDYIQLITAGKAADINGREQEIAYISRNLKSIAKDLNMPIIALSQLSRKVEERGNKTPMLSDLRESGSIEQDADMVMFIYRPEYYGVKEDDGGNPTEGQAQIIIAKHRNGSLADDIILGFEGRLTKFTDRDLIETLQEAKPLKDFTQPNYNFEDEAPF